MVVNYRDLYAEPVIGKITQGTIFNGAFSRSYSQNYEIYGLVISPRCDIDQRKAPLYYYLPTIRLSDWMQVDFPVVYIPRLRAEVKNFLQNQLVQLGESISIMDKFSAAEVEKIFCKHSSQLRKALKERIEIWKALEGYRNGDDIAKVMNKDTSNVKKNVFDELIAHKNPNFYFLENKDEGGFVIRMREISRLTPEMLFRIANGIDKMLTNDELRENDLCQLAENNIYMPLYEVKSPFIEHVMQHFMQQFNRIGVEDVDKAFVNVFLNRITKEI